MNLRHVIGLLLALVIAAPAVPEEETDADVRRLLAVIRRDDDPTAWSDALRTLRGRGGEIEARLDRTLAELLGEKRKALATAAERIRDLASRIGDGEAEARKLAAWDAARTHARAWIFDRRAFPDIEGAIFGPQEGYTEAIARGNAAVKARRPLEAALSRALSPLARVGPEKAAELRRSFEDARRAVERVGKAIGGKVEDDEAEVPPIAWLLLDVAEDRLDTVGRSLRDMPAGWEKFCVFEAYGRGILARNRRDAAGQSAAAVKAIVALNDYRMALGHSPLAHHARLAQMAMEHSREMARLGYLDHESPVPENRTVRDRARNAGYDGSVQECVSGRSSPSTAVETWKWDGGHHRIMLQDSHCDVGVGDRGPCVLDAGNGEKASLPGLRY